MKSFSDHIASSQLETVTRQLNVVQEALSRRTQTSSAVESPSTSLSVNSTFSPRQNEYDDENSSALFCRTDFPITAALGNVSLDLHQLTSILKQSVISTIE